MSAAQCGCVVASLFLAFAAGVNWRIGAQPRKEPSTAWLAFSILSIAFILMALSGCSAPIAKDQHNFRTRCPVVPRSFKQVPEGCR